MTHAWNTPNERDACGVGFVAALDGEPRHEHLRAALKGLDCVEHRGGCLADRRTGDGAGVMAEVPYALFGYEPKSVAVATLFIRLDAARRREALEVFETTLQGFGLEVVDYRTVPVDTSVLGRQARETMPHILHAFIPWPEFCRTESSFNTRLYMARQTLRSQLNRSGMRGQFFTVSASTNTIIYKALTRSEDLAAFYPDLSDSRFTTRFALFHRRFSTNTSTSWDKAQPFRMIAHNGEINTIACNLAWSYAREQALGLPKDELLTHQGISDSGSLNEMVEALRYRSSIPRPSEILAIMVPPAGPASDFYRFWGRAVEPWDGPAFLAYSDGETVGARLDRNGFRPCRWVQTNQAFYLASEAGIFDLDETQIVAKGHLHGGTGAHVELSTGEVQFEDPSHSRQNEGAIFDARLEQVGKEPFEDVPPSMEQAQLFGYTDEEIDRILVPMCVKAKEPIGSMGDTARPAVFSEQPRSFFDFFFQTFAQVTNPPLDALRERMVTDLSNVLGKKPNVFQPKELIPMRPGIEISTPVLSLAEMAWIRRAPERSLVGRAFEVAEFSTTFARVRGAGGLEEALSELQRRVLAAIRGGCSILILSDRMAKYERPPIPSLLALRAANQVLVQWGHRLDASIVMETADVRTTHHVAALVGFGAAAVCPYYALQLARHYGHKQLESLEPDERSDNLKTALEAGLLKIMSKMGISTVRGYQSSELFTAYGLSQSLLDKYFPEHTSMLGGVDLKQIAKDILQHTEEKKEGFLPSTFILREHRKGAKGEKHAVTSRATSLIHEVISDHSGRFENWPAYEAYVEHLRAGHPVSPRHLMQFKSSKFSTPLEDVQPIEEILRKFGSGAMSFGAISAESQRDIIHAMRRIGGRSASGEGGENPYYYVDGTTATTKQVASGRFGVRAEYLVIGDEIEIKVAQGAKPGEGGQLMGIKVDAHIARARNSMPNVDLISPPPLHDIYSIEDLRELIYELKQLKPGGRVCVKLVSGANIGAIAAGVVKAGADIIQISGGDGGTGAASISSMRHAGLPWELGLVDAHRTLVAQDLREHVILRVDGGLMCGEDIIVGALLGAEEFSFGKGLLIAEGCIMARVCEKNTCPRGIATHDPRFKKKYRGTVDDVVAFLTYLAEDVRRSLSQMGFSRLDEIVGRGVLLEARAEHQALIQARGVDVGWFDFDLPHPRGYLGGVLAEDPHRLNQRLVEDAGPALSQGTPVSLRYPVRSTDRAVLATLGGAVAQRTHRLRMGRLPEKLPDTEGTPLPPPDPADLHLPEGTIDVTFEGSAGQGFGVFLTPGVNVTLWGEANDSVAKSIWGGKVVIRPPKAARYVAEDNAIIGNCALYGATGGVVHIRGRAADRFAVRNSGATAVVEATGLHACEYMTNGTVVILGDVSHNVGAGMTGGQLYLRRRNHHFTNDGYIVPLELSPDDETELRALLEDYVKSTESATARKILDGWEGERRTFLKYVPKNSPEAKRKSTEAETEEGTGTAA